MNKYLRNTIKLMEDEHKFVSDQKFLNYLKKLLRGEYLVKIGEDEIYDMYIEIKNHKHSIYFYDKTPEYYIYIHQNGDVFEIDDRLKFVEEQNIKDFYEYITSTKFFDKLKDVF